MYMRWLSLKFLLALILGVVPIKVLHAAPLCSELTSPNKQTEFKQWLNELADALGSESQKISNFLRSETIQRVLDRRAHQWLELDYSISQSNLKKRTLIDIENAIYKFNGSTKIKSTRKGVSLEISINAFRITNTNLNNQRKYIPYAHSPQSLNKGLFTMLSTVLASAFDVISRHPEITHIDLKNLYVVNPEILDMLKNYGFNKGASYESLFLGGGTLLSHLPTASTLFINGFNEQNLRAHIAVKLMTTSAYALVALDKEHDKKELHEDYNIKGASSFSPTQPTNPHDHRNN